MIKIAITKGRIEKQVCKLLAEAGFDMDPIFNKDRELLIETKDGISMIFGKPNDVVTFLEHGIVDIGFVGKDTLDDVDFEDYYELLDLEIGKCYFAVAAYPEYRKKVFNRRKKIASKYTNVAKKYFASKQEDVEIIKLEGSVELGPVTGISDAIVDIVETGSTLKANGLEVIEKVSDISTRMIVNKVAFIEYDGNLKEIAQKLNNRKEEISIEVNNAVNDIINDIRKNGNQALINYCRKFDGYQIKDENDFVVSNQEKEEALKQVDQDYIRILERTKQQITEFHKNQIDKSWSLYKDNGVIMGQMVRPIERVALYVPGGTAAYPSTVLMNAIPAKLAGVKDLVIITPVKADGKVNPVIVAAAKVSGVDTIYKFGGAQGVAAIANGTETIEKVDKIVGPGNIFVATAKKLSYGVVDIDMVAGPSEVLVIADENANPKYIAADLMSQAEHDKLASAMLVTTSKELAEKVNVELKRQMAYLSRKEIIEESLQNYGGAILVKDLKEAFEVSNYLAPEHLEVLVENPVNTLPYIKNAGSIFLGEYSPEPLGDYMSGTNHVLPTGGTAKFYSALGVYDFVKYSSYSYYPREVLETFKDDVQTFAKSEGLDAHANSIAVRFEEE